MTELREKIREAINEFCSDMCAEAGQKVLLGVLKLHQPESVGYIDRDGQERNSSDCEVCGGNGPPDSYPCATVLAIAKGLGLLDDEEET